MSGNGNQVPLASGQRGPGQYPRATTPHSVYVAGAECYHPPGATGAAYMPSAAGGAQPSAPASLRVPPTAQPPSVTQAPQQDLAKTTMAGHSYVAAQNQSAQTRQQYQGIYRPTQHPTRPNTHARQQQPFIGGAPPSATGPVMYPVVFQTQPLYNQPSYQQTRAAGFYNPYMPPYMNYPTPTSHTTPFLYPANSQQYPASSLQTTTQGSRNNSTTLGTPGTPTATFTHPPAQTHIQTMPGIRPIAAKRQSYRLPIIDPKTQQDILETYQNDSQYVSGDSRERQTPQPDALSVVEEFSRKVNEVANQPTAMESAMKLNYLTKNSELPLTIPQNTVQPQINTAINPISNIIVKSDILTVNESKNVGPDIVEPSETPIVSAISDSPVIVPKIPINNSKQISKSESPVQPLVVDTNKIASVKQQKQTKSKPSVPQTEEDKPSDTVSAIVTVSQSVVTPMAGVNSGSPVPPPVAATQSTTGLAPQPQRTRESKVRVKPEEKQNVEQRNIYEKEIPSASSKPNGPTAISSVDNLTEIINTPTSQNSQVSSEEKITSEESHKTQAATQSENELSRELKIETTDQSINNPQPSATERLSASIEKLVKEPPTVPELLLDNKEVSSAIQAQAKLTQSITSCTRNNQPQNKMKDINLNNKAIDTDTANGNTAELTETVKEDINKNEKSVKNAKNISKKSANKMADSNSSSKDESTENGKDEADNVTVAASEKIVLPKPEDDASKLLSTDKPVSAPTPPVFVPKYRYSEEQWSPLNTSGKKIYDLNLLKQIRDDPLSKNKPNDAVKLEACNVIRPAPMLDFSLFPMMSRNINDTLMPAFVKGPSVGLRNNPRDTKKDGRNIIPGNKGSVKMMPVAGGSSSHKPIVHFVSLRGDDVKLNETENAWKPTRFKQDSLDEEEAKTQDLYNKFRGILNKLTPQKFETLLDRVKHLEINNQKRLEGVIDLVFEKAIDEPNFSEAYAAMCSKLSTLKVPADNASSPDQCVNFRALIITKCQNQFTTDKVDEQILKLEKELAECTEPVKKKELQLLLEEESRRVRMRSVGNVRFIGELYKLKMLTHKIMVFCMNYLIDKLEEEKLECLCKLLTTIGEQVESEAKDQVDIVFKKMQEIVDKSRTNKISSRVRFMIQDVIALRKRRWVVKSVIDSQPKMMDQIQKEAEQQHRQIEIINASSPMGGGFRQDAGNRGKRDGRRQNSNTFVDNNWKTPRYVVDTAKFKAVTQNTKNVGNIKLAPHSLWSQGSGTRSTPQTATSNSMISISKNMYSALENIPTDPSPHVKGNKDTSFSKGASIERSSFASRSEIGSSGANRPGSMGIGRSISGSRSTNMAPVTTPPVVETAPVPQEPLPDDKRKLVKPMIDLCLINPNDDEMVAEVKERFNAQYHVSLVTEIINVALEKSEKQIAMIAKSMMHIVSTNTISANNFVSGLNEIFNDAPDYYIDIPMLYDYLSRFIAPQIEKKHVTFKQIFGVCGNIISSNHGHLLLKAIIRDLKDSMGPTYVKGKWQESGLQLKDWMDADQVAKWVEDNKFEFLESSVTDTGESKKILTPSETQKKLLQLMSSDENHDCIKGWVQDNLGKSSNEDWFMRSLIQAICEYALSGSDSHSHFSQERMNKYSSLINEFGETREAREASCLFGIQQLIHRLEHPQGLTLEIFQNLHEHCIISDSGFIAWEVSELEPEGKGVMVKALTSFFTNIKEAENEDSGSED